MDTSTRLTEFTRVGFDARGLLYVVIAPFVVRAGRAAAGLSAYGLWRLTDAALGIERHGSRQEGAIKRLFGPFSLIEARLHALSDAPVDGTVRRAMAGRSQGRSA